jgi:exopolysaccharide/PEP-CTERM locus tyrosine autokinase
VSIVERAIGRLQQDAAQEPTGAATAVTPIGRMVTEPPATDTDDAATLHSRVLPARRVSVDREALRESGYLPEITRARQFADQYRHIKRPLIRAALEAGSAGRSPRLIMMASALPGDGKTFTSLNLALSMARERDISLLLVDADVPKPHISRILGIDREPGLLDALKNPSLDIESLVLPTDAGSLSILPAGRPDEGATELLASKRMTVVMNQLIRNDPQRVVLFDSPPLLLSSESSALAAIAGQIVLVVRSGKTPCQAVVEALGRLGEDRAVSLVLNEARVTAASYYGYGGYGNYGVEGNEN